MYKNIFNEKSSIKDILAKIENKITQAEKDRSKLESKLINKGVNISSGSKISYMIDKIDEIKTGIQIEGGEKLPPWYKPDIKIEEMWINGTRLSDRKSDLTSSIVGNRIYCIGGVIRDNNIIQYLDSNECYDILTNTITICGRMSYYRNGLTSSTVDNKIYAIGGWSNNSKGGISSFNECYDTNNNTWTIKKSATVRREDLNSETANNKIYCAGGHESRTECYDPNTDTWTNKTNASSLFRFTASSIINNKIYFMGDSTFVNYCYDVNSDTWSSKQKLSGGISSPTSGVSNNKIHCIGGYNGSSELDSNKCYDPNSDSWTTKLKMNTARSRLTSCSFNNSIYCFGGRKSNSDYLNNNEIYIP